MNFENMPTGQPAKKPQPPQTLEMSPNDPQRLVRDFMLRAAIKDEMTQNSLDILIEIIRDNYLKFARNKPSEIPEVGAISNNIRLQAVKLATRPGADYESVYNQLTDLVSEYIEKKYPLRGKLN